MEALVHQKKKMVLILLKQKQSFVWMCITMLIIVTCLWMEKKSINLKLVIKIIEISFKGNVYDFSVDYDSIDKSDILNNHKYLMIKNTI